MTPAAAPDACPTCGQLLPPKGMFNDERHEVLANGEWRYLKPMSWKALGVFRRNLGRLCTRGMFIEALYEHEADWPDNDRIVDVYLSRVRRALQGTPLHITTVFRMGWRLEVGG